MRIQYKKFINIRKTEKFNNQMLHTEYETLSNMLSKFKKNHSQA